MDAAVHYQDALRIASEQYYAGVQGHLWVPSSNLEVQSVIAQKNEFHQDLVWIAASDEALEGKWIATAGPYNGTDVYELIPWHENEPGGGLGENCVAVDSVSQAHDYNCNDILAKVIVEFVCDHGTWFNDQVASCVGKPLMIRRDSGFVLFNL